MIFLPLEIIFNLLLYYMFPSYHDIIHSHQKHCWGISSLNRFINIYNEFYQILLLLCIWTYSRVFDEIENSDERRRRKSSKYDYNFRLWNVKINLKSDLYSEIASGIWKIIFLDTKVMWEINKNKKKKKEHKIKKCFVRDLPSVVSRKCYLLWILCCHKFYFTDLSKHSKIVSVMIFELKKNFRIDFLHE